MKKYIEQPFEYLRKNNGSNFSSETVENWYMARAFVLDKLKDIAFKSDEYNHLHVVVDGDSDLMLAVVRQVALSAHYINYDEEERGNRTVITLVSNNPERTKNSLATEEYLGNLLDHCKYSIEGSTFHEDSYIDIELEIVKVKPEISEDNPNEILIEEVDVVSFCHSKDEKDILRIDTRKAQYADRMYQLGTPFDNLPSENIHDAHRYTLALDIFQYQKLQESIGTIVGKGWNDENNRLKVKNGLSNIICADCFESRAKSVEKCRENVKQKDAELWEKLNEALSKSEHARWVVEKLIMGFRPLSLEERMKDENLAPFKSKRNKHRKELKNKKEGPAHIDLCSYNDLRRINPDDMKYDSFLMLAIPMILKRISEDDN